MTPEEVGELIKELPDGEAVGVSVGFLKSLLADKRRVDAMEGDRFCLVLKSHIGGPLKDVCRWNETLREAIDRRMQ